MKISIDGQKLAMLALKKNLTRDKLSEVSSVSKGTLSAISSGRSVHQGTAQKLCTALGVDIEQIAVGTTE